MNKEMLSSHPDWVRQETERFCLWWVKWTMLLTTAGPAPDEARHLISGQDRTKRDKIWHQLSPCWKRPQTLRVIRPQFLFVRLFAYFCSTKRHCLWVLVHLLICFCPNDVCKPLISLSFRHTPWESGSLKLLALERPVATAGKNQAWISGSFLLKWQKNRKFFQIQLSAIYVLPNRIIAVRLNQFLFPP